jgi:tetratricopeptide (TPR) repeat protein
MLEKDRERRYHSAAEVSRDLELVNRRTPRVRPRWKMAGIAVAAALLGVVGAIYHERRPAPVLTDKDTVVLADFANKTGDPIFNETLRQGLAVELRQSPFLSLVSDERIQHVLRLMAKPPDTPLTVATAREICERTESAAVLDGSISSLGKQYVLLLRAQNCRTGELLFAEQRQATRKEEVLGAISQLAGLFRKRAGESLTTITQHSTLLPEATTPSLEAWKSFSEGMRLAMLQGHAVAIPFIKHATEIDPHFATAEAFLGRDYGALGEMELARKYVQQAFQDRDRASDQERFLIDFSYDRVVTGNLEKALETCELWTHTYPRDAHSHALYGSTTKILGLFDKTVEESKKAIEIDADTPYPYDHLADVAVYQGNFREAQRWLDRASERKLMLPDFLMTRHRIAFLGGDSAEMERVSVAAEHLSEIQDWIWGQRAAVLAFSGHMTAARRMWRRAVDVALAADRREAAAQHEAAAAVREAFFGNSSQARRRAAAAQELSHGKDAQYGAALAFAISGDLARAQMLGEDLEQRYPKDTVVRFSFLPALRAFIQIQRGNPNKAVDLLSAAARYELGFLGCCSVGFVGSLYPIYARGEAYLALHRGSEAAAEFQKIHDYRGLVGSDPIALLAHWRRGKALVMAGRDQEAKAEYERFLSLWGEADSEVPILRRVKGEYGGLVANHS